MLTANLYTQLLIENVKMHPVLFVRVAQRKSTVLIRHRSGFRNSPWTPSFVIDGGLESQVADASELALFDREVWFVKTRSFETTPKGVTKNYNALLV